MLPGGRLSIWFACLSFLLLLLIGAHLHPLGYLLAGLLAPLPVLLAGWRLGDREALLLVLAGVVAVLALNPGLETLWTNLSFLSLLLMGFLLSALQHRGVSAPGAIMLTVLILSGLALLLVLGQAVYQGVSLQVLLAQRGADIMKSVHQVLGGGGAASGGALTGEISPGELEALLKRLLPALVVTNTGLVAWLNVVLARQLAWLWGGQKPAPPLYYWALPEWLIFVALGAGFLLLVPVAALRSLSLNLLLITSVLYFCQGLGVMAGWFHRLRLPLVLRIVGYGLLFLNPLFFLIIILGVLDLWFDFRRLHRQPGDAGGGIES
ncbi:MAG: DUF2232 domain-containing protein [Desulfobaccales bacterium]